MRPIICESLNLVDFEEEDIPSYVILSHTWGVGEVSYDIFYPTQEWTQLRGAEKILWICRAALRRHIDWAWIDTYYINKSSSSELSEAINSMYKWYQRASRCFVYLCDFDKAIDQDFYHCRWFQRGWTLQELVASRQLDFRDKNWKPIASIGAVSTIDAVSQVTGIDRTLFDDETRSLERFSVAQKMSWMSGRDTRKPEDMAYSLLGIFGVNMPLLYGEGGRKAFTRLQEAIITEINDLSLFAWTATTDRPAGILAIHPQYFEKGKNIISYSAYGFNPEFTMTNKGLRIEPRLMPWGSQHDQSIVMPLNCHHRDRPGKTVGIILRELDKGIYVRERANKLAVIDPELQKSEDQGEKLIYIRKFLAP